MNLKTLTVSFKTLAKVAKKSAPTILSIAGAGGVVATGVAAAKAGYKDGRVESDFAASFEPLREKAKRKIKTYLKPALIGAASIGCIVAGDRLHMRRYAALGAAASVIQNRYDSLRHYLTNCNGYTENPDGTHAAEYKNRGELEKISRGKADMDNAMIVHRYLSEHGIEPYNTHTGDELWYEPITKVYFLASEKHVNDAEYMLNRNFKLRGNCPFSEWLRFLGLPEAKDPEYELIHWDDYEGEAFYGYMWIDFVHVRATLPDGPDYIQIFYPFEPHLGEK